MQITPNFVQLTADAVLKAFWRKSALRTFLKQHRISDGELATWTDESKRQYVTRLFDKLVSMRTGRGDQVVRLIAASVCEMEHFPDLEHWEDSPDKIRDAREAVARLRPLLTDLRAKADAEAEAAERRQRAEKQRLAHLASEAGRNDLGTNLQQLLPILGTQEGGYAFERWVYDLFTFEELICRRPYVDPKGRQIDGSLTLDGTTFLLETKFTQKSIGSPDVDVLLSKVRTKADNTMALFVSFSGYNTGALQTATHDRTPLLLIDGGHLYNYVLQGTMSVADVVRRVWRHSAQTGQPYLAPNEF